MASITVEVGPISSVITVDDAIAQTVIRNYLETIFENGVNLDSLTNQNLLDMYVRQLAKHTNGTGRAKLFEDARKQSIIDVQASAPGLPEVIDEPVP